MTDYLSRTKVLQDALLPHQLILISRPADIQYLVGFVCLNPEEREAFLVITSQSVTLLYPSFSPLTRIEGISYHSGYWPSDIHSVVVHKKTKENITECFIDKSSLFVNEYDVLSDLKLTLSEFDRNLIWRQRIIKDTQEIKNLKTAGEITAAVMAKILGLLKLGITEEFLAQQIEIETRKLGAQSSSFPPVVAFGKHAALPHHQPTAQLLEENMCVLIDMGARYNGYCGDMTRTTWFGKNPSEKFITIEKIVKQAYAAAFKEIKAGCSTAAVDKVARTLIEDAGYGQAFIHTTGHGVGLEIHEQPSLYFKKDGVLTLSSVVTIEPGIYVPGEFGYRYENMVLVEEANGLELTV